MTPQQQAREDLAEALTGKLPDGIQVFPYWPEKVAPPFVAVGAGTTGSYIEFDGVPFGGRRIHLAAVVVVAAGSNDVKVNDLDEKIELVMAAIEELSDFAVDSVQPPGQVPINNNSFLGASVEVLTEA